MLCTHNTRIKSMFLRIHGDVAPQLLKSCRSMMHNSNFLSLITHLLVGRTSFYSVPKICTLHPFLIKSFACVGHQITNSTRMRRPTLFIAPGPHNCVVIIVHWSSRRVPTGDCLLYDVYNYKHLGRIKQVAFAVDLVSTPRFLQCQMDHGVHPNTRAVTVVLTGFGESTTWIALNFVSLEWRWLPLAFTAFAIFFLLLYSTCCVRGLNPPLTKPRECHRTQKQNIQQMPIKTYEVKFARFVFWKPKCTYLYVSYCNFFHSCRK